MPETQGFREEASVGQLQFNILKYEGTETTFQADLPSFLW